MILWRFFRFLLLGLLFGCLFVAVFCLGDILFSCYLILNQLVMIMFKGYGLNIEMQILTKIIKICELKTILIKLFFSNEFE